MRLLQSPIATAQRWLILAAAGLATVALAAGGCRGRPSGPLSPSAIRHTPAVVLAGTAGLPTAAPTLTSTVVATRVVAPPEPLEVAPGFQASVFAEVGGPVWSLGVAPNGDVFATVPLYDRLLVLPDRDRDGVADGVQVFAEGPGLNRPGGIAFRPGWLYVANTDSLVGFPYEVGDLRADQEPEMLLPLPAGGVHWSRDVVVGADGALLVSVGASCDACIETDPRRAAVLRLAEEGPVQVVASGLRAVGGLAVDPLTGVLWGTENGRVGPGSTAPTDELNRLLVGGNYGWPGCMGYGVPDESYGATAATCAATIWPAGLFAAGTAPQGGAFAGHSSLPPEWQDDLFVAAYGGEVAGLPSGYKVIRVGFEEGAPTGELADVVAGWLRPDTRRWGRPSDVAIAADGALLVADEGGQRIYRLSYETPPTPTPTPPF